MIWESSGKMGRVHWGISKKLVTIIAKYIPFFLPFSEKNLTTHFSSNSLGDKPLGMKGTHRSNDGLPSPELAGYEELSLHRFFPGRFIFIYLTWTSNCFKNCPYSSRRASFSCCNPESFSDNSRLLLRY